MTFLTHDGGTYVVRDMEKYKDIMAFGSIHVGERTFIGYKAIIMLGVKIGKRCIIGAGAVVTHDIPDYSVAVGVPARVISSVDTYAEKMLGKSCAVYDLEQLRTNKRAYLEDLVAKGKI